MLSVGRPTEPCCVDPTLIGSRLHLAFRGRPTWTKALGPGAVLANLLMTAEFDWVRPAATIRENSLMASCRQSCELTSPSADGC